MSKGNRRPPSKHQQIINLVEQRIGRKDTMALPRVYIQLAGDPLAGLLLSEIVWYSDKSARKDGWFWKSAKEWRDELELSYAQVKRLAGKLEQAGYIETRLMRANGAPTTHYRPRMGNLTDAILDFLENRESLKSAESKKNEGDFQESRNSRKSKDDFQESRKSIDFQESRKSITALSAPTTALRRAPPVAAREKKPKTPSQQMFAALAVTCAWDVELLTKTQRGALNQTEKKLRTMKNQTVIPQDVLDFGEWWRDNDWRGKQGEFPRPDQVRAEWGRFRHWQKNGGRNGRNSGGAAATHGGAQAARHSRSSSHTGRSGSGSAHSTVTDEQARQKIERIQRERARA